MNGTIEEGYAERRREEVERDKLEEKRRAKLDKTNIVDIEQISLKLERMLLLGLPVKQIKYLLTITAEIYNLAVEKLKADTGITDEQILEARAERIRMIEELTIMLRKKGYTNEEIAAQIEFGNKDRIKEKVRELKKAGKLTKKDIENGKTERRIREFVLKGLQNGLTEIEIATSCKIKELGEKDVIVYIDELIELHCITVEQIIEAQGIREEKEELKRRAKEVEPFQEQIEHLYRLGFSGKQITKITKLSDGYVRKIRDKLGITVEHSKEWQSRREEMADKRRFDISKMVSFTMDIDTQIFKDQIEYLKAGMELDGVRPLDIKSISKIILMEHSLLTLGNINFAVRGFSYLDKLEEAVSFINECLDAARTYEDTKNNGKLISMRELLERKIARQKEEQAKRGAKTHKSRREAWIASSVKATPQREVKPPHEGDEAPERADTRSVVDSEIAE